MECLHCHAPMDEGAAVCPVCGADQTAPAEEETLMGEQLPAEEETLVEEPVSEDPCAAEEECDAPEPQGGAPEAFGEGTMAEPEPPKKKGHGWIFGLVGILLLALLVGFAMLYGESKKPETVFAVSTRTQSDSAEAPAAEDGTDAEAAEGEEQPEAVKPSYTLPNEEITEEISHKVVAAAEPKSLITELKKRLGGNKPGATGLTNAQLQLQYWLSFNSFYQQNFYYLMYMGMDPAALEKSDYDGTMTWQEYFLQSALEVYRARTAIVDKARAEGFTLSQEEQEQLDTNRESFLSMENLEELVTENFGPGVTPEDYIQLLEETALYAAYMTKLEKEITCTAEEAEAYYDAHAEDFQSQGIEKLDQPMVNVRHILITPENIEDDASWTAAEETANALYEQWKSGEATEDSFAALAAEKTDDTASAESGGLYESVYPGRMVAEFNDWCFDEARKPGDSGIVKTEYGYHILYFVGQAEEVYWRQQAMERCKTDKLYSAIDDIAFRYVLWVDLDSVKLGVPETFLQQSAAAQESGEEIVEEAPAEQPEA